MNSGQNSPPNWHQQASVDYEVLVHPHAIAVNMREPGEKQKHGDKITYENPVEWALKEGSFYSLNMAIEFLNRLIGRLIFYKSNPEWYHMISKTSNLESALARVQQAIKLFHDAAKILAKRRKDLQILQISNEYDVQDILHCILKPQFPDISPEEYSPPVGSGAKRIDLVIPLARIVVEIKVVPEKAKTNQVVDELKIDIESYHSHPACSTLVCFVYNPNLAIENPEKIILELSGTRTKGDHVFEVIVAIHPR